MYIYIYIHHISNDILCISVSAHDLRLYIYIEYIDITADSHPNIPFWTRQWNRRRARQMEQALRGQDLLP